MIYYEYNEEIVKEGLAPAVLCCSHYSPQNNLRQMVIADRVFYIENGFTRDIKNRLGYNTMLRIYPEEELVLKLRAVLI